MRLSTIWKEIKPTHTVEGRGRESWASKNNFRLVDFHIHQQENVLSFRRHVNPFF